MKLFDLTAGKMTRHIRGHMSNVTVIDCGHFDRRFVTTGSMDCKVSLGVSILRERVGGVGWGGSRRGEGWRFLILSLPLLKSRSAIGSDAAVTGARPFCESITVEIRPRPSESS